MYRYKNNKICIGIIFIFIISIKINKSEYNYIKYDINSKYCTNVKILQKCIIYNFDKNIIKKIINYNYINKSKLIHDDDINTKEFDLINKKFVFNTYTSLDDNTCLFKHIQYYNCNFCTRNYTNYKHKTIYEYYDFIQDIFYTDPNVFINNITNYCDISEKYQKYIMFDYDIIILKLKRKIYNINENKKYEFLDLDYNKYEISYKNNLYCIFLYYKYIEKKYDNSEYIYINHIFNINYFNIYHDIIKHFESFLLKHTNYYKLSDYNQYYIVNFIENNFIFEKYKNNDKLLLVTDTPYHINFKNEKIFNVLKYIIPSNEKNKLLEMFDVYIQQKNNFTVKNIPYNCEYNISLYNSEYYLKYLQDNLYTNVYKLFIFLLKQNIKILDYKWMLLYKIPNKETEYKDKLNIYTSMQYNNIYNYDNVGNQYLADFFNSYSINNLIYIYPIEKLLIYDGLNKTYERNDLKKYIIDNVLNDYTSELVNKIKSNIQNIYQYINDSSILCDDKDIEYHNFTEFNITMDYDNITFVHSSLNNIYKILNINNLNNILVNFKLVSDKYVVLEEIKNYYYNNDNLININTVKTCHVDNLTYIYKLEELPININNEYKIINTNDFLIKNNNIFEPVKNTSCKINKLNITYCDKHIISNSTCLTSNYNINYDNSCNYIPISYNILLLKTKNTLIIFNINYYDHIIINMRKKINIEYNTYNIILYNDSINNVIINKKIYKVNEKLSEYKIFAFDHNTYYKDNNVNIKNNNNKLVFNKLIFLLLIYYFIFK